MYSDIVISEIRLKLSLPELTVYWVYSELSDIIFYNKYGENNN